MIKKSAKVLMLALAGGLVVGCSNQNSGGSDEISVSNVNIFVEGYEFGPAVSKLILESDSSVETVEIGDKTSVKTVDVERKVTDSYLSDENGNKLKDGESSKYVTLDLEVTYNTDNPSQNASPFTFDMNTFRNLWASSYEVDIENLTLGAGSSSTEVSVSQDAIDRRVAPELAAFSDRGEVKGEYVNPSTNESEEIVLQYAATKPDSLKGGEKNPLIIWLHGGGEGGTDVDIVLLGNEVTALNRESIQNHFKSTGEGSQTGSYVLAVQAPTLWMDDGSGEFSPSAKSSRYTEALMKAIEDYIATNDDIDTNRIYLTGCSNGGYMSVEMGLNYQDYFAALVPIATPYPYYNSYTVTDEREYIKSETADDEPIWFDDSKVSSLVDTPIWFIHSAADKTISPTDYALPDYKALLDGGAENSWFSYYETVQGSDMKGVTYSGHWSWLYFFNNQVTAVQDKEAIAAGDAISGFSANENGGSSTAKVDGTEYSNLFDWLNAQSK